MMKTGIASVRATPIWVSVLTLAALAVSACDSHPDHPALSKVSTPQTMVRTPSPYPPLVTDWDIAGSLTGDAKDFAQFAAETQADQSRFLDANTFSIDLLNRYNERVVDAHKTSKYNWEDWHVGIPATGGVLVRAIDSTSTENGQTVTLCVFNTPGEFSVVDGHLQQEREVSPNTRTLRASTITVESTTEPSGVDAHVAKAPRLLAVSFGYISKQDAVNRCDKFAPEPFVQTPPSPNTPTSQPK